MSLIVTLQSAVSLLAAYLAGSFGIRSITKTKEVPIELSVTFGYGLLMLGGVALALASIFTKEALFILIAGTIVAGRRDLIRLRDRIRNIFPLHKRFFGEKALMRILAAWVAIYTLISFLPYATGGDGLSYHIPFALDIIDKQRFEFPLLERTRYGHLPMFAEVLYAIPTALFENLVTYKVIQWFSYIALLTATIRFVRKNTQSYILPYAYTAGMLSLMPLVANALGGGSIDVITYLFGISAVLILIHARQGADLRTACLAGMLVGWAAGTKYLGLAFGPLGFIAILLTSHENWRQAIKKSLVFAASAALVGGFWYIKNFVMTGNPFYPMFDATQADFSSEITAFAIPVTPLYFLLFPFLFFGKAGLFTLPYAAYTAAQFALSYILFFAAIIRKKIERIHIILFVLAQAYLGFVFPLSHQIRFAVPALILNLILIILLLDTFFGKKLDNKKTAASLITVSVALAAAGIMPFERELACLTGSVSEKICEVTNAGSEVYAVDFINKNLAGEAIIEYWNPYYRYRLTHDNIFTDTTCGLAEETAHEQAIANCLERLDIQYLIDDTNSRTSLMNQPDQNNARAKNEFVRYFREHGKVIYEYVESGPKRTTTIRLYQLTQVR